VGDLTVSISVGRTSVALKLKGKEVRVIEILKEAFPKVTFECKDASHDIYASTKLSNSTCIIFGRDVLIASGMMEGMTGFGIAEKLVMIYDKVKDWYLGLPAYETRVGLKIFK